MTYAKSHDAIMDHLRANGWTVVGHLKVPHATSPDGRTRLWFKAQAVWVDYGGAPFALDSARSTWVDTRRTTPALFLDFILTSARAA